MKRICQFLILSLFLISCSKDDPQNIAGSQNGKLEYKVNGSLVSYENIDATSQYVNMYKRLTGTGISDTRYQLAAFKGANTNMSWAIVTDSLLLGSHIIDSASSRSTFLNNILFNGQQSSVFYNGDNLTFNITDYRNGRVSGTFTGRLSPATGSFNYSLKGTTLITDGILNNVQVIY